MSMHGIYAGNNLSGSIPPQIFHLLLRYLYLDGNSLNSGEIQPDEEEEIGNLTRSLLELSIFGKQIFK